MPSPNASSLLADAHRLDELLWKQKILTVAIDEQRMLVDTLPAFGIESMPWEENLHRLKKRLRLVRNELASMGYEPN